MSDSPEARSLLFYLLTSLCAAEKDNVTSGEQERFDELTDEAREIIEASTLRLKTRIESLEITQRNFQTLLDRYNRSIIEDEVDIDDDFETAYAKERRAELIETEFNEALKRVNFEIRDAIKAGVTPARSY